MHFILFEKVSKLSKGQTCNANTLPCNDQLGLSCVSGICTCSNASYPNWNTTKGICGIKNIFIMQHT